MTRADSLPSTGRRRRAFGFGLYAETCAVWLLRLKGYRVLARRYKTSVGEVDIVACRRRDLVFVEVKARQDWRTALHSVSPRQRQRIERASGDFLARHPKYVHHRQRFDLVLVQPWRRPRHMVAAWRPGWR